jgi:hypothetical protein
LFGHETGVHKKETVPGSFSSCNLFLHLCAEVNYSRGLPVKVLMLSLFLLELEVPGKSVFHRGGLKVPDNLEYVITDEAPWFINVLP